MKHCEPMNRRHERDDDGIVHLQRYLLDGEYVCGADATFPRFATEDPVTCLACLATQNDSPSAEDLWQIRMVIQMASGLPKTFPFV